MTPGSANKSHFRMWCKDAVPLSGALVNLGDECIALSSLTLGQDEHATRALPHDSDVDQKIIDELAKQQCHLQFAVESAQKSMTTLQIIQD